MSDVQAQTFRNIPIALLREAAQNPRQHFDPKKLEELTASIRVHGVRTPLLVRPNANGHEGYEIGAGHRRWRAALEAGLAEVPAVIRPMGDIEFLELLTFENLQREDVHPLEEAEGYRSLIKSKSGYDVAKIGERVGKSASYVYDRLKLLELTPPAQKLFRDGTITAGHAILLARLDAKDQARAIGPIEQGRPGGLFTDQRGIDYREDYEAGPDRPRALADQFKAVSVREFQSWIDRSTKLEAAQADPMLFPETVQTLTAAAEASEKVVRVTYNEITPDAARDGKPIILGRSWKRADGKAHSKTCDRSVIGMIVIGPGRGEALRVCVDKKRCTVHWADLIKAAKKREAAVGKEAAKTGATGEDREAIRRKKKAEERAALAAEAKRWDVARPAMLAALSVAVKKAPAGAAGALGKLVLEAFDADVIYRSGDRPAAKIVPAGKTAEDLVRHMGFAILMRDVEDVYDEKEVIAEAKAFGVDLAKILAAAAPVPPPAKAQTSEKKAKAAKA